ncbi:MAG: protease complex subunit PrcB family protein [Clostridia bacterium]|jgi:hypothetical protein|nr:protease complex subunit PrcB family protein [Lachnospiraceae bacterium]NCB99592.1 protease complex subunit PrcB family protein [Clostridia bacterium]NCD01796.1 protease complex subunit PrcB family protein [Clostridia bacterium]
MRNVDKKILYMMMATIWVLIFLCSCSLFDASDKKVGNIDFTVINPEELPEEIREMIEERQKEDFQMAYHDGSYSYIIVGYGQQETSGYSIQVKDVYQGENGIWVDTNLIGPEKSETVEAVPSYPYVVIKIEIVDQTIRFKS